MLCMDNDVFDGAKMDACHGQQVTIMLCNCMLCSPLLSKCIRLPEPHNLSSGDIPEAQSVPGTPAASFCFALRRHCSFDFGCSEFKDAFLAGRVSGAANVRLSCTT